MSYNLTTMQSIFLNNKEITLIKHNNKMVYQKSSGPDYTEPFYVENISDADETLSIKNNNSVQLTIEYSTDKTTWQTLGTTSATGLRRRLAPGDKVYLRCSANTWSLSTSNNTISGTSKVGGNIMSLLYGSNFTGEETSFPSGSTHNFYGLFNNNSNLVNAKELLLPATTLTDYCYYSMFQRCTSLTSAPALPATTLAQRCYFSMFQTCVSLTSAPALPATTLTDHCYYSMFNGCIALTSAPALPATTLASNCYRNMFQGCTSLTQAPALPATTLASDCYYSMFQGCRALTSAPALPATTLSFECYRSMFQGCTSLTQAPVLPATTLAIYCYQSMFQGCTSLTQAPALPATTLSQRPYLSMFQGCTSLTQAPALPATTLTDYCYYNMFNGCRALNNVTCLATNTSLSNSISDWLANVSSTGTFTKAAGVEWPTGGSGIPDGWTVVEV